MHDKIAKLDDATAVRVVRTVAEVHRRRGGVTTGPARELGRALRDEFEVAAAAEAPSEGDLARQALLLLADEPETRQAVADLIDQPRREFLDPGTLAVTTAVLILLQTYVHFQRNPDGTWSLEIKKEPTSDTLLKPLLEKLLSLLGLGGK